MAGSIPLSLTQQFDKVTHELLVGGKLYSYAPGTTTPQSAFQTAALAAPFPNPITLDSDGRIPYLWFADGSIRVRLTNEAGVLQFDADNLQVSGAGGGGAGVDTTDPNSIFSTGMIVWMPWSSTKAGWLRCNGLTLGSVSSGASSASALNQALFQFLWNNIHDSICTVTGGRGATALDDWNANKRIGNIDLRGRALFGLDDMGAAAANRINGALITSGGSPILPASSGGEDRHQLVTAEIPAITPTGSVASSDSGHTHATSPAAPIVGTSNALVASGGISVPVFAAVFSITAGQANITSTFAGNSFGGNGLHNNMSPFMVGTYFIRQ